MKRQALVYFCLAVGIGAFAFGLAIDPRALAPKKAQAGQGDNALVSQANDSAYQPDNNFQAFRSSIAVADTLTTANVLSLPAFQVQNRTTFYLGARFTNSAATVGIRLAYVWRNPAANSDTSVTPTNFSWKTVAWTSPWLNQTFMPAANVIKGWSPIYTLTAGTASTEGSYFPAPDTFLDTERATTIRIVVTAAVSAGTVSFWTGS